MSLRTMRRCAAIPVVAAITFTALAGPADASAPGVPLDDVNGRIRQAVALARGLQDDGIISTPVRRHHVKDFNGGIVVKPTNRQCIAYDLERTDIRLDPTGGVVEPAAVGPTVPPVYDCPVPDRIMNRFRLKMYPQGEQVGFARRDHRAIYPFRDDPRALMVQNEGHSDRFLAVFENADAPTRMDFKTELPDGYFLDTSDAGKLFYKYQRTEHSKVYRVGEMGAPWARDSAEQAVTTRWEIIDGNTIRLNVVGEKTVFQEPITYPLVADPWVSAGWDWYPPGPIAYLHLDGGETKGLADAADSVDNLTYALCALVALAPPPAGPVLSAVCGFIVSTYFEMIEEVSVAARDQGCGSVFEFDAYWNLDAYSVEC